MTKPVYRLCSYCGRIIPPQYDFNEHKKLCKNVDKAIRPINLKPK